MAEAELAAITKQCRRAVVASGMALGLVFALALSGAASITLMFDATSFQETIKGFEGVVLDTLRFFKPMIRPLHALGGYAGFVLAGWAAVEMLWLFRLVRRAPTPELRAFAPRVLALGVIGGAVLAVSVGVLVVSGTMASTALRQAEPELTEGPEPLNPLARGVAQPGSGDATVNEHTRQQTYFLGIAALLLAAATSQARKAAKLAREQGAQAPESPRT